MFASPDGLVLDPFAGSGTTGGAAIAEGRRVLLIEREAEYARDIRIRLNGGAGTPLARSETARCAASPGVGRSIGPIRLKR